VTDPIRVDGQVAIVTGASRGLGREYALALAQCGACVVVNARTHEAAARVADEVMAQGGQAMPFAAEVSDSAAVQAMVDAVLARWHRVDILVNNAGFVRDRSFAKLEPADFRAVLDAHVQGSFNCTHAVWRSMMQARHGRIVMIVSSSGLAGNFGQTAYAAAKMALVGMANTLGLEGEPCNVRVNCFAPIGITGMNEAVIPAALHETFAASHLRAGIVWLASQQAPNRVVLLGGAGSYERAQLTFTRGCRLVEGTPEELAARFAEVSDRTGEVVPASAVTQMDIELAKLEI
jgi:NAD(P)-dependent dehydrogenase (short-subunit alcohol dehydrogenase family)